jgi:hypothetical protein
MQNFIGSLLVIHNIDNHYVINRVGNSERLLGWLSILWTMVMLPVGMIIGNVFFGKRNQSQRFDSYCKASLCTLFTKNDTLLKIVVHILLYICILSSFYVFYSIGSVPLFETFKSPGSAVLKLLRIDAKRNFTGNEYIRNIIFLRLSPIISYICYCYYKLTKKNRDRIYFILSLCNAIIAVTYNLEKSPLFFFFMGFLFIKVIIDGSIPKNILILSATFIVVGLIGAYWLIMGKSGIGYLLFAYNSGITGRILLTQTAGMYLAFKVFPNIYDFIGIRSLSRWIPLLFGLSYSERSARLLKEYFDPRGVAAGTTGVMNSLFIQEAWANFGTIGVILSPLVVGIIIGFIFQYFLKKPKTPVYVGIFTFLSLKMPMNGGNEFIYPVFFLSILAIIFFIKYTTKFLSISAKRY